MHAIHGILSGSLHILDYAVAAVLQTTELVLDSHQDNTMFLQAQMGIFTIYLEEYVHLDYTSMMICETSARVPLYV
ncbi:unnamed protein product [Sphenostylis stenocarpa]|uniref:Uncharacterized protein n=1 Tax=Sphenostylis stenocarpa TaxID=92480 RepID=A0AA86T2T4_9FABA|nr:unnamed protein product [Sphenostylis stenocarpa]